MKCLLRFCAILLCMGLVPGLSARSQSVPVTPPTTNPSPSGAPGVGDQPRGFKNLKVLPDTISQEQLRKLMRQYSGELGVECEFCHASRDPVTNRSDRASDANPTKDTARFMIGMTDDLNNKYLAEMPSRRYADPITCGTCHRGEKHPSIFVPPPRQEGSRPPGAQPSGMPPGAAPQSGSGPSRPSGK